MRLLRHTSSVVRTIGRSLAAKDVLNVNLTIVHRHWYAYHHVFTHWSVQTASPQHIRHTLQFRKQDPSKILPN